MRDHEVRVQRVGERFPRARELAWRLAEVAADPVPVEPEAAEMAANRVLDDVVALEELLEQMRTSDQAGFPDADLAFHAKIAAMARNVVLEDMLASIRTVIRGWVERNIAAAGTTRIAYRDHVPIYRAIAAGDPEAARAAMAAHMQAAIRRLLAQDRRRR